MNDLFQETSPYLLQHAQNPVHWKAWGDKALAQAVTENKLLLVSIGYSACHWCHVMEHETFEDHEAAALMNANFINIKVDREERPDVDAVYMKAVQIMTGRGGWPMNAICLPDGRPVFGGTYFRKQEWMGVLAQLQELWASNPEKMVDYAQKLQQGLHEISIIHPVAPESEINPQHLKALVEKWRKSFDHDFGGMARAPKFMLPNNYEFLMRYGYETQDEPLLHFVDLTLTKMAFGGLFDAVGGGFSRYSVDLKWHVPHFEKMLYDNGQLVSLYAQAFKRTRNQLYKEVIQKTLAFVSRELSAQNGAFYSALDADSLAANGELEEGAFYVWSKPQLEALLGDDFALFAQVFSIGDFGHWENGNYVLIQKDTLETLARHNDMELGTLQSLKEKWEQQLFDAREKRHKPRLDDKCLTSWNALMLKGYADAYMALGDRAYLQAALQNAQFLIEKQWHPDGQLWHSNKDDKPTINGYLEDYALVIDAFLTLYTATLNAGWLDQSKQLADYCFDHFFDSQNGFFRFTSDRDPALIAPHFEIEDNVIMASNSVMARNLYRLGIYFENGHYTDTSKKMLLHLLPGIDYPSAFSNWLQLALDFGPDSKELAICGAQAHTYLNRLHRSYLPNLLLAGTLHKSDLPFLRDKSHDSNTRFYLCEQQVCQQPETDFENVNKLLKPLP